MTGSLLLMAFWLAAQAAISAARAALNRAEWGYGSEASPQLHDITRRSSSLDLVYLLVLGGYFATGVAAGFPRIQAGVRRYLPEAVSWLPILLDAVYLVAMSWISLAVGMLAPEALGSSHGDTWGERCLPLIHAAHGVLQPLSATALALGDLLARGLGAEPLVRTVAVTEEEIKSMVTVGERAGVLEEEEREMIYSIFQLGDTITREVMIPRTDIVALDAETPPQEALSLILNSGHSRIPLYAGTIDNVVGILYAKDMLRYRASESEPPTLAEIARNAYFVPESKRLDTLLREIQRKKVQLAIVVDEYGSVSGLVTLEDIVEEIVGEIQDEYDQEEPSVLRIDETTYLFDARIPLDDVQAILDIPFPLGETDSLGGFIYKELGHIPAAGERLTYGDVTFEIMTLEGRRILQIKATQHSKTEEETDQ